MKKKYLILSGEGERGTWELTRPITTIGLQRRLTAERSEGRWADAYRPDVVIVDDEIRLVPLTAANCLILSRADLIALGYSDAELPR